VSIAVVRASEQVDLRGALRKAKRRKLFASLYRIYAGFPETNCPGCARCCFESPGLFFVEHVHLLDQLARMPQARQDELLRRALSELFFSWIDPQRTCIFLESSRCILYGRRPLACRLFGLVSPHDREAAEAEARMAAREEARRLSMLGITVPEEIVTRALLSCDRVRDGRGRPVRHVDADVFAAQVARLDEVLLPRQVVLKEFCFRSLPDRLGAARWGGGVEAMRIDLLKRVHGDECVEGLVDQIWDLLKRDTSASAVAKEQR